MPMIRPPMTKLSTTQPAPEVELVDVTCVEIGLDTGLTRTFTLEKGHKAEDLGDKYVIEQGERKTIIATHRILYVETYPHQLRKVRVAQ